MYKIALPRLCACLPAALALAHAAVFAAEAPLTLSAVQARVLDHNPGLQALAREMVAQDGLVRQAAALPNPELSGQIEDRQSATRSTTILLTQTIETGGKRAARVDAAERERELAAANLELKRAQLRASASAAFHTLLAAQESLKLADATLLLAQHTQAMAGIRVSAGKNSPVDATRAAIATAGTSMERAQAQLELEQARETLAALWGGNGEELSEIDGRLEQLPQPLPLAILQERIQQTPEVLRARMELQRRLALGRVETARRMPDVGVSVGSKRDEQLGRRQAVFGLSLPLPLFDRNQGKLQESLQRSEQARDELAAAAAAQASQLRRAHARLLAARRQATDLSQNLIPSATEVLAATRKGYEYGKFALLDVFDAQRVLMQAQAQQLRVLAEGHGAAAELERIFGAASAFQSRELP